MSSLPLHFVGKIVLTRFKNQITMTVKHCHFVAEPCFVFTIPQLFPEAKYYYLSIIATILSTNLSAIVIEGCWSYGSMRLHAALVVFAGTADTFPEHRNTMK